LLRAQAGKPQLETLLIRAGAGAKLVNGNQLVGGCCQGCGKRPFPPAPQHNLTAPVLPRAEHRLRWQLQTGHTLISEIQQMSEEE